MGNFDPCMQVNVLFSLRTHLMGFTSGATDNLPASAGELRNMGLIPGSGRSPGGGRQTTPVFLPGESYGQRNLAGYGP